MELKNILADDLLEQAHHLANREIANPKQASLRRAVSTAYYVLFHLLIDEAVGNWGIKRHRSTLARTFDHGKMRAVCDDIIKQFHTAGKPEDRLQLVQVARAFTMLQHQRHIADYDNSILWTQSDVLEELKRATEAFAAWRAICDQDSAQDYLLSLFLPKLPRQ